MGSPVVILNSGSMVFTKLAEILSERGHPVIGSRRKVHASPAGISVLSLDEVADGKAALPPDVLVISLLPMWVPPPEPGPLSRLLPRLRGARRIIAFSSTQVADKKVHTPAAHVRSLGYRSAEQELRGFCSGAGIPWTILRPTGIYLPPYDHTVMPLAQLIRRFRFLPLAGFARGLRQPVHAHDLAMAAVNALSSDKAVDRSFDLPGGETLTFRAMAARIFRALGLVPLMVPVPTPLLALAFQAYRHLAPSVNGFPSDLANEVLVNMNTDMTYDIGPARVALDYRPRAFTPEFPSDF